MATKKNSQKKKDVRITTWILHVQTSQNNTLITLTDVDGNKVVWWWCGSLWYKWAKRKTPYAAELLTKDLLREAQSYGLKDIGVVFRWTGMARDWVFKAINELWSIDISYIKEATPIQFGGCKRKRPKRN